jgi:membrane-bound serine protease (ClpP class)
MPDAELLRQQPNWSEDLVAWLTSPFVRGILSIILLMALYSEMQAPGLGLAGGVALLAAAILFGAPYLTGLAEAWEIIIVVVGLALLAVEIFFIPGFGVAGISACCSCSSGCC